MQIINESVGNHSKPDSNLDVDDYILFQHTLFQYSVEAVIYIAEFVSLKLGKKLTCQDCLSALYENKADFLNSLIHYKSKGCKISEKNTSGTN